VLDSDGIGKILHCREPNIAKIVLSLVRASSIDFDGLLSSILLLTKVGHIVEALKPVS